MHHSSSRATETGPVHAPSSRIDLPGQERPHSRAAGILDFASSNGAATTGSVHGAGQPFQRWYRFKEAFSPQFVADVMTSLDFEPRTCSDPFGGSGTTGLTCQFLGIRPTTIEVNPFLQDLIEAKLSSYHLAELIRDRAALAAAVEVDAPDLRDGRGERGVIGEGLRAFPGAPPTFEEPGRGGRWIFDRDVAHRIARYRDAIDAIQNPLNQRLFRVLLGAVVVPVSNVVISGKGRRYRAPSARQCSRAWDVDRLFDTAFQEALYDIGRYHDRRCREFTLLRGDSRALLPDADAADVILFSPPYPNSFDYTDIYNVELWALGYLTGAVDNRALREATIRSHVQIRRDFGTADLPSPTLTRTLASLTEVRDQLWDKNIPSMVRAYADDMLTILRGARATLTPRGRVALVVGDSRYAGVRVDVPTILRELAPSAGLRCEYSREVRAMRSSAQQGGEYTLGESLMRFAPDGR
jgi:hypothetical protein